MLSLPMPIVLLLCQCIFVDLLQIKDKFHCQELIRLPAVPFRSVHQASLSRERAQRDWSEQTSRGEPERMFSDSAEPN